jgi:hypothetical protein
MIPSFSPCGSLDEDIWHSFPFPEPWWEAFPHSLVCKQLEPAAIKTVGGVTKTAAQVQGMPLLINSTMSGDAFPCGTIWSGTVC